MKKAFWWIAVLVMIFAVEPVTAQWCDRDIRSYLSCKYCCTYEYHNICVPMCGADALCEGSCGDRWHTCRSDCYDFYGPPPAGTETQGDIIVGTTSPDVIFGDDGDDMISGNGGADSLFGAAGSDHVCLGLIIDNICQPASQINGNNPFGLGPNTALLIGDIGGLTGSFNFDVLDSRTVAGVVGTALHSVLNDAAIYTSLPGEIVPWNGNQYMFLEAGAHPIKLIYQARNNGVRVFAGSDRVYGFDPARDSLMLGGYDAEEQGLLWSDCQGGALASWAGLEDGEGICFVGLSKGTSIVVDWKPRFPLAGEGEPLNYAGGEK